MPIVSKIGRKTFKTNLLFAGMYAFLIVGGLSMIYPFMLMLSGSTKSAVDIKYFDVIPRFLRDDTWLYRKHIEALFNENLLDENMTYDEDTSSFEDLQFPADFNPEWTEEWVNFINEHPLPVYSWHCGHIYAPYSKTTPSGLRLFKAALQKKFGKRIEDVNRGLSTDFVGWNSIRYLPTACLARRNAPKTSDYETMMNEFKTSLPLEWRYYFSVEGFYKKMYLKTVYSADIRDYNRAHGTKYAGWNEVRLPRAWRDIQNKREQTDWEDFVRNTVALQWIRVDNSARPAYQAYLQAKYENTATLNRRYGTKHQSFGDVPLIGEPPLFGLAVSDWDNFISGWKDPDTRVIHKAPVESLRIFSVEYLFRDYLRQKYKTVENMNRSLQTSFTSFEQALPPQRSLHYRGFMDNKRSIKWDFIARNYKTVVEYMVFHGRGIINTVIYCTLAVLIALLINPLAAYALSRYKMPPTYKILLFLMATMAFPAMVTQIPNFLMLRRLNLLNTFAALVLPGMANGYSIFLLKGFFDSLPRELYESAQLDGASEWTMFWSLTMSLSKPILAVIALSAFTHAYANFMFAFVVCQDEKMWTLMVWLYQLRQMSGQAVMYASLIIAAIPTFIIFLFCQNIIMRGIVVPSEK